MKKFYILFLFFSIISYSKVIPNPTDTSSHNNFKILELVNKLTADDYNKYLDTLNRTGTTNFLMLRLAYTTTKDYDPYSTFEGDLKKEIYNALDSSDWHLAEKLVNQILQKNYVYSNAHMFAGYIYNQLGDSIKSKQHYYIEGKLIESMEENATGLSTDSSIIVINANEEYSFMGYYEIKNSGNQELINAKGHAFDEFTLKGEKSGKEFPIFFNVDIPMGYLANQYKNVK